MTKFNFLVSVALAISVSSCGGGSDQHPVPPGATISIAPASKTWNIPAKGANCVVDPNVYNDELVNVSVLNKDGVPLGEVDIHAALDLSGTTFSGAPVLKLYDDTNGNGVPDANELVSDVNQGVYNTTTDRYEGNKYLWIRVNLSCPYRGVFTVYAGAASGSMQIEVAEQASSN